jgi:hypothetical protein
MTSSCRSVTYVLARAGFTEGSPAAVAYLERSFGQRLIPSFDLGESAYTALLRGLESLSDTSVAWPEGFDTGVAFAIGDMGKTFARGVNRVSFTVNQHAKSLTATLDAEKLLANVAPSNSNRFIY